MRGRKTPPLTAEKALWLAKSYSADALMFLRSSLKMGFVYAQVHQRSARAAHYALAYLRATQGED